MRRTPLTAMLTLAAVLASTFAVAGCGGGNSSTSSTSATTGTTQAPSTTSSTGTTPAHKHKSKPAY